MRARIKPPGSEISTAQGYVYVKTVGGRWRLKHRQIWEAAHGPIPKGRLVKFADGDRSNFSLDNLVLVSRSEIGRRLSPPSPQGTEHKKSGYIVVMTVDGHWRFKHRQIWEAAHGPIPKDHQVKFADGDRSNFSLDNLVLISRSESGRILHQHFVLPVGAERVWAGVTRVKIAEPNVWRVKHRLIWEAAHGPIPKGSTVWFADGDWSNFSLDNLILITLQEQACLLRKRRLDLRGDLLKSAVLVARLEQTVSDKQRKIEKATGVQPQKKARGSARKEKL
jgi:hypothetical protein